MKAHLPRTCRHDSAVSHGHGHGYGYGLSHGYGHSHGHGHGYGLSHGHGCGHSCSCSHSHSYFKIAPLDNSCNYVQNCKATGTPKLLAASCFCLKFGMSKKCECDLDLWDLILKLYYKIEFYTDTSMYVYKIIYDYTHVN